MSKIVTEIVAPAAAEAPTPTPEVPENTTPLQEESQDPAQPKQDDFSNRFAALARKEKHLRDQEAKAKAEAEKYRKYQELESKVKENPLSVLESYGLSLDDIISASLGDDAPAPTVEDQIKALKDEIKAEKEAARAKEEERLKAEQEAYQARIDEAIAQQKTAIKELVSQNQERYELINLHEAQDLVWDVTEAHFDAHNEVLTPEQASDKVEEYLENQVRKAMELSRFKKKEEVSNKGQFSFEDIPTSAPKDVPTLTADLAGEASNKPSAHLDPEESKRRAAALLKWT